LNFISKILERLFLQCIQPHILASPNYNQHQSAYRPGHSTETALVQLHDSIYHAADHGKATRLFPLDLSAAFDTIDHPNILHRLAHNFGITGSVFTWVQSYLTGRSQIVRLGSHSSNPTHCLVGVPQGSVLGPLLFTIYTSPISHITEAHNIQQHQYADDTQLFLTLTSSNVHAQVSTLESCLSSLQTWFCANSMILNPDKSNSILFATTQRACYLSLSCYLIRSLLISQGCRSHSLTMSKYWVLCLTHVSLYLNTSRLSQNPVFITFVPQGIFVAHLII